MESDYNVVKGNYSQIEEGGGVTSYREISDHTRLAKGGEVDVRGDHRFPNTATRGKIAEGGFPLSSLK